MKDMMKKLACVLFAIAFLAPLTAWCDGGGDDDDSGEEDLPFDLVMLDNYLEPDDTTGALVLQSDVTCEGVGVLGPIVDGSVRIDLNGYVLKCRNSLFLSGSGPITFFDSTRQDVGVFDSLSLLRARDAASNAPYDLSKAHLGRAEYNWSANSSTGSDHPCANVIFDGCLMGWGEVGSMNLRIGEGAVMCLWYDENSPYFNIDLSSIDLEELEQIGDEMLPFDHPLALFFYFSLETLTFDGGALITNDAWSENQSTSWNMAFVSNYIDLFELDWPGVTFQATSKGGYLFGSLPCALSGYLNQPTAGNLAAQLGAVVDYFPAAYTVTQYNGSTTPAYSSASGAYQAFYEIRGVAYDTVCSTTETTINIDLRQEHSLTNYEAISIAYSQNAWGEAEDREGGALISYTRNGGDKTPLWEGRNSYETTDGVITYLCTVQSGSWDPRVLFGGDDPLWTNGRYVFKHEPGEALTAVIDVNIGGFGLGTEDSPLLVSNETDLDTAFRRNNGSTYVKLTADVHAQYYIDILSGRTIVLDLNGHSLICGRYLSNNGSHLTIVNSGAGGVTLPEVRNENGGVFVNETGPKVVINSVKQRYPWNGLVDIVYSPQALLTNENYAVRFYIAHEGVTNSFDVTLDGVGTFTNTWNAAEAFGANAGNLQATVRAVLYIPADPVCMAYVGVGNSVSQSNEFATAQQAVNWIATFKNTADSTANFWAAIRGYAGKSFEEGSIDLSNCEVDFMISNDENDFSHTPQIIGLHSDFYFHGLYPEGSSYAFGNRPMLWVIKSVLQKDWPSYNAVGWYRYGACFVSGHAYPTLQAVIDDITEDSWIVFYGSYHLKYTEECLTAQGGTVPFSVSPSQSGIQLTPAPGWGFTTFGGDYQKYYDESQGTPSYN